LLHVGQEVEAKILNIETSEKKISLGLKQLEPDPWDKVEEKFPINSKHKGIVRNLTQFGAFVELEEGIDGLVHISDLSWTKKIRHPSEVVKKGDEIEVIVLGINREERRIALGHKQVEENPWDTFQEKYKIDTETSGVVSRIIDKGVIVTLPLGVDGFIPSTHLGGHDQLKKAIEYYKVGDEVPAKVIEFDKENKKIVLSVINYFKDKEQNELEDYLSKQGVEKTSIEELLKEEPKQEVAAAVAAAVSVDVAAAKPAEKEKPKAKTRTATAAKEKKEKAEGKTTAKRAAKKETAKEKEKDSKDSEEASQEKAEEKAAE